MKQTIFIMLIFTSILATTALASAYDFNETLTPEEQATFDHILEPVMRIYNLVKYVATGIAALVLLLAGIHYMTSGSDPKKRDNAKSMAMYVVIGLVVIWAAPWVVQFIVG